MKSLVTALLSAVMSLSLVHAAEAAQLGDPAAPLQISAWTKGAPVDLASLKGKQVAVVEFWATWCPPCRESIPHLTELQKKFKDVVFIGVSNEDPDTVKKFVAKMGDKMDYHVAVDQDDKTSDGYMKAYGIDGIPHAFIVGKDGTVLWNGHPMDGLDEALTGIQAGKYDMEKAKKRTLAETKLEQFVQLAQKDDKDPQLDQMGRDLEALDKEVGGIMPGQTFKAADVINMVRFQKLAREYGHDLLAGASQDKLDDLSKQLEAVAPKDFKLADFKQEMTARKVFGEYYEAAASGKDNDTLAGLARKVEATKSKNPETLTRMASAILTDENIKTRDYSLAADLAKAAVDSSDSKDPAALNAYAHALFESGKPADALAWQKKAVAAADNDDDRQQLELVQEKYQNAVTK